MSHKDPFDWLQAIYRRLHADKSISLLANTHQFARLVDAVEQERPDRAAELRQYSQEAQQGVLAHLARVTSHTPEPEGTELWRATKDSRELRCVVRQVAAGADLVVFQNGELRNSQLCPSGPDAHTLAALWKAALAKSGWTTVDAKGHA